MRDHEPGCVLYSLPKPRSDSGTDIVHEQYDDQAALDAHQSSEHGQVYFPKHSEVLEKIGVEYYDVVVP
jgi:quinol monooxygenase YgiN